VLEITFSCRIRIILRDFEVGYLQIENNSELLKEHKHFWARLMVILVLCLLGISSHASTLPAPSDTLNLFEYEKRILTERILYEKDRIASEYKNADDRFFNLTDSVINFIEQQPVSRNKKNQYLNRMLVFLRNINRYYSNTNLKSGTYLAVLSYFPVMIEWDQKDELLRNIKRYSNFSIKAIRLIPNDTIAEEFLTDYLTDHPDDIFRNAEEFDDRPFALRLLEKAVKLAPESVKRYYSTSNAVSDILITSRNAYVKKSFAIFNEYGTRSRAYLLLDAIVNANMSISMADSIGKNPDYLFRILVQFSMKYEANVSYSIYRYMDIYASEQMRKINLETPQSNSEIPGFNKYSPEEMFVLISYGFRETTLKTFQSLVSTLQKKSTGTSISSIMIASLDKQQLKDLVIFCDQNQMLEKLLGLVDDEKKDYLLALTSMEEKEIFFPPFKTFGKNIELPGNNESDDLAMNEITKAKPTSNVKNDDSSDETLANNEKIISEKRPVPTSPPVASIAKVADAVPVPIQPVEAIEPIKIELDEKTRNLVTLKKNIFQTLNNIPDFINQPYAEEVLAYAAEREPDEVFKRIETYRSKPFCLKILQIAANNAPVSLKRYMYNARHPINFTLSYSKDAMVKKIYEINPQIGYQTKPLLLMDDIINQRMQLKDAMEVSQDPRKLFGAMVKIISRPNYVGKYSIDHEMRDYSLRFIREINDKIAAGNNQPFYSVEGFSSAELYFLMLQGRDEVFTSTFNGLFKLFKQKLPSSDGEAFLKGVNKNQFRNFISLCASFDKLEEFLATFSASAKNELLVRYSSGLEKESDDISNVVMLVEALSNTTDRSIKSTIQSTIKKEYERLSNENNKLGMVVYGVLASMISETAVVDVAWWNKISKQYKVVSAASLASSGLFNQNKTCVEQMYFYNDDDGRSSFVNFMKTYKNQPLWKVEDRNSYVRIYSSNQRNVEILANKPEYESNGISSIAAYLQQNNLSPSVIVHRGHSFHTETTLEKVPSSAKLIFVGSCGGFYKQSAAIENAPDAHIISTKQIGTKGINDVLLFALNENIREGRDISWNDFWDKMQLKFANNHYFSDYVPPHKNLESIYIRAYYNLLGINN
jgi:hypothetical protein